MSDDVRVFVAQAYPTTSAPSARKIQGFAAAWQAWRSLADERLRSERSANPEGEPSDEYWRMDAYGNESFDHDADRDDRVTSSRGAGSISADTPGHSHGRDEGMIYRVSAVRHADYPHEPGRLYDCRACESMCHCTAGSAECVYIGEHQEGGAHPPRVDVYDTYRALEDQARERYHGDAGTVAKIRADVARAQGYVWGREDAGEERVTVAYGREVDASREFSYMYGVLCLKYELEMVYKRSSIRDAWRSFVAGVDLNEYVPVGKVPQRPTELPPAVTEEESITLRVSRKG